MGQNLGFGISVGPRVLAGRPMMAVGIHPRLFRSMVSRRDVQDRLPAAVRGVSGLRAGRHGAEAHQRLVLDLFETFLRSGVIDHVEGALARRGPGPRCLGHRKCRPAHGGDRRARERPGSRKTPPHSPLRRRGMPCTVTRWPTFWPGRGRRRRGRPEVFRWCAVRGPRLAPASERCRQVADYLITIG